MVIKVKVKNIYGKDLVYPLGNKGYLITKLTGSKTLSALHIEALKALGFSFENVKEVI